MRSCGACSRCRWCILVHASPHGQRERIPAWKQGCVPCPIPSLYACSSAAQISSALPSLACPSIRPISAIGHQGGITTTRIRSSSQNYPHARQACRIPTPSSRHTQRWTTTSMSNQVASTCLHRRIPSLLAVCARLPGACARALGRPRRTAKAASEPVADSYVIVASSRAYHRARTDSLR